VVDSLKTDDAPQDAPKRATLPWVCTPEELAKHFGWSARKVREKIRMIGAYRQLGNAMIMTKEDVDALLEACKPAPSRLTPSARVNGGYQELLELKERQNKKGKK
jgi:hypothetical protein